MKLLCILLVLVNITYFLWEYRLGHFPVVEPKTLQTSSQKQIFLASEHSAFSNSKEKYSSKLRQPKRHCLAIGPFKQQKSLDKFRRKIMPSLYKYQVISVNFKNISSFMVQYPAPKNLRKSLIDYEFLKEEGMKDIWLFKQGDFKGSISLGLYKTKRQAENAKVKLVGFGLNLEVVPYPSLWLTLKIKEPVATRKILRLPLFSKYGKLEVKFIKRCK